MISISSRTGKLDLNIMCGNYYWKDGRTAIGRSRSFINIFGREFKGYAIKLGMLQVILVRVADK